MSNYSTEHIRTVALVGHGASGKTTLAEALLAKAGAVGAAGSVEKGTTVSDFDPLEKTWKHSLRASIMHLDAEGTRVHLIDTRRKERGSSTPWAWERSHQGRVDGLARAA